MSSPKSSILVVTGCDAYASVISYMKELVEYQTLCGSSKEIMEIQNPSSDIISTVPKTVIENILTHMPIRDAIRTSILSKKWRFCWTSIPKLIFDNEFDIVPSKNKDLKRFRLARAIFHLMLRHTGSILEFYLNVGLLDIVFELDLMIQYLSRSNKVKNLVLKVDYTYKVPSSFFSLQGLEHLELVNCDLKPLLEFNGFSMLKSLKFSNVTTGSNLLQTLLSSSPLLMDVYLREYGCQDDLIRGNKFTFLEFLSCSPLIRTLDISTFYLKYLGRDGMPEKLPTSLVHLKYLLLDLRLTEQDDISSAFCLIRSSPNLEEISFRILNKESDANSYSDANSDSESNSVSESSSDSDANSNVDSDDISTGNSFDLEVDSYAKLDASKFSKTVIDFQDYSGFNLDHLKEFTMENFTNHDRECKFMKLLMAKSPMLKTARITLSEGISIEDEIKILRDIIRLRFQCASTSAEIIVEERNH